MNRQSFLYPDDGLENETYAEKLAAAKVIEKHVMAILKECNRACEKHPQWPTDIIHQIAVMTEEAGESMKAALEYHYEGKPLNEVRKELIHTGAMVLRCLVNLEAK